MLKNYIKVALKVLLRRKFFTFISLFGISFTLMVLTVGTAMVDHTLAPESPESRKKRILGIYQMKLSGEFVSRTSNAGYGFLDQHARNLPHVEKMTIFSSQGTVVSYHEGRKIQLHRKRTDGAFWEIFDFEFLEGGPFAAEDEEAGNFVAVINESTRKEFFGNEPAVGRRLTVDGQTFRMVGVVRDVSLARNNAFADIWVPLSTAKSGAYRHQFIGGHNALLLARSPADFPEIKAAFQARVEEAQLPDPERYDSLEAAADTYLESLARTQMSGGRTGDPPVNQLRAAVLGGILLFMLLPAVNLVNLNLSRILERSSEIGVRKAFGASSRTLVGQFVVENVILTLIGGLLGFLISGVALGILNSSQLIPYAHFQLNYRVFGYGLLLAVFFGVFSGVYPAWKMSRVHPVEALRGRSV